MNWSVMFSLICFDHFLPYKLTISNDVSPSSIILYMCLYIVVLKMYMNCDSFVGIFIV